MKKPLILFPALFLILLGLLVWHPWRGDDAKAPLPPSVANPDATSDSPAEIEENPTPPSIYETRRPTRGGIGKIYMGREISQVMGHEGIDWLERDNREEEEAPSKAIAALDLKPDAIIADIGAGSGYYTFRIAELVPDGQVMAVDIQPEMIAFLEAKEEQLGLNNVTAHLGAIDDTRLDPESIDAALMVDAYHEFSHPREIMESIFSALRPGGRVFLLEYRAEDSSVPIKPLHKMTEAQAIKEMEAVGLKWEVTHDFLPWQHFMVFKKEDD
ncbi:class I SAM-dependent methyltransferase [Haloferula sp.]|uniref:class I SAM-dependent methyltransferase n=1 Tax=Haloferula sp. TaxID=2497595 RepID=UPI003C71D954